MITLVLRGRIKYNSLGDVRIICLPIRLKSYYRDFRRFIEYDEKLSNSISRSKSKVLDYTLNNDFKYFVTLTFNNNLNSFNLAQISNFISQRIRDIRKKYKIDFKYVLIPEKHKKGDYHLHGFFDSSIDKCLVRNEHGYLNINEFDFFGYQCYLPIRNYKACCKYVTKYITKELATFGKGKHLYFCSKGLKTSEVYDDKILVNYNKNFSFDNDFVKILDNCNTNDIDEFYLHCYDNYN